MSRSLELGLSLVGGGDCASDWEDFARLLEGKSVGVLKHGNGPDETMDMAIAFVKQRKPSLTFVHCDHVDSGGHKFGDDTSEYYQAVAKADALVGRMLAALNDAGIADRTIVLITSDHGGVGKKHGGATMANHTALTAAYIPAP